MTFLTVGLLSLIEGHLPTGQYMWDRLAGAFNEGARRDDMRDAEALKNKFIRLKNHPKPTGDPDCPEEVRRAKRVQRLIEAQCAVLELEDNGPDRGLAPLSPVRFASQSADDADPGVDAIEPV